MPYTPEQKREWTKRRRSDPVLGAMQRYYDRAYRRRKADEADVSRLKELLNGTA